jgi:hypothetical protein
MFELLTNNPLVLLYILQALTYGAAALLSEHKPLIICYSTSALLHSLVGICHLMHVG